MRRQRVRSKKCGLCRTKKLRSLFFSQTRIFTIFHLHFLFCRLYNTSNVDRAPCGLRDCAIYVQAGYIAAGAEGSCLSSPPTSGEPTVAVTLYFNGVDDNMGGSRPPADGQNWEDVDLECLAYAQDGPGRVPLEIWRSVSLHDYWTLASATSRSSAQAAGSTLFSQLGFIDAAAPPPDPDAVEAYAYVVRLEWPSA